MKEKLKIEVYALTYFFPYNLSWLLFPPLLDLVVERTGPASETSEFCGSTLKVIG